MIIMSIFSFLMVSGQWPLFIVYEKVKGTLQLFVAL